MIIRRKLPRGGKLHEPIRYPGSHPRPVTRRQFMAAGLAAGQATLLGGPALLAAFADPRRALAASTTTLACDVQALQSSCGIITNGAGKIPFIVFDLAGGANLTGSEALIGGAGGQLDFLSTAGYGRLGLPGDMLPNSPNGTGNFVDTSLGLAWHSDGAILRGIKSMASAQAMQNTNGVAIAAVSQTDTQDNPHNPMYGIYMAGANGSLLPLIGTMPTVSGGNSMAPSALVNLTVSPTVVTQSSNITGLVNTGQLGTMFSNPADAVSVLESTIRLSGGTSYTQPGGKLGQVTLMSQGTNPTAADLALKQALECGYVKSTVLVNEFGNPATLNPDIDPQIVGSSGIFTPTQYTDSNFIMTAAVMKMVVNGFAGAGTITLSGYDYHDSTRATGETKNFQAGQCIGACLEYAKRVGVPLMVYVISDGSLVSTGMIDSSAAGRGKFGWQGDSQTTANTFFLVYNPQGRPTLTSSTANQIGAYTSDGNVDTTSSPAANSVTQLVYTVLLNYMALHGQQANFASVFGASTGLGTGSALDSLISFAPVVNGVIGG